MPPVIRDMPWVTDDAGEDIVFPDGRPLIDPVTRRPVHIRQDQIVLWASLAPEELTSLPPDVPVFPILLDTGFNDWFLMHRQQAWEWLTPDILSLLPETTHRFPVHDAVIFNRQAALWLHPNIPGSRDRDPGGVPFPLVLSVGATLAPPGRYAREKPLLGVRAVRFNGLTIRIDGVARRVWIDTP